VPMSNLFRWRNYNESGHLKLDGRRTAIHIRLDRPLEIYSSIAFRSCSLCRSSVICFADLYWETKTIDKDIHQAENTRLPAGLIVHVAHTDEGAKEIFGTDVGAYLSSGNGAVQQDADRFRQPFQ
jgi:hypothetical protein